MQQLPHSIHAEQHLIATLLRFNEAWPMVRSVVKACDFYLEMHQVIFGHLGKLLEMGEAADAFAVDKSIERSDDARRDLYLYYHAQFAATPHPDLSASNVLQHATIVREKSILRSLVDACTDIIDMVQHPAEREFQAILDTAESLIFRVTESSLMTQSQSLDDVIKNVMGKIGERSLKGAAGELSGLETGFAELDERIQGFQRGDLVLLTSRPGMGQRALAMKILEHRSIAAGCPVLIFSLELSIEQLGEFLIASRAKIAKEKLRRGRLSESDREKVEVAAKELREATVIVSDYAATRSIVGVRAQMRRVNRQCKQLDLIVIDSLQTIADANCSDDCKVDMDRALQTLKEMALELSVPILVLAELSDKSDGRDDKRPRLMDLRQDGISHQLADLVLSLHREDRPDSNDPDVCELHVLKNLDGPTGIVRLGTNSM